MTSGALDPTRLLKGGRGFTCQQPPRVRTAAQLKPSEMTGLELNTDQYGSRRRAPSRMSRLPSPGIGNKKEI